MFSRLILYLGMLAIGVFIGFKEISHEKILDKIDKLQMLALVILLFVMGIRIGADEMVVNSIGQLGVQALVITIFIVAFSILFVWILRKLGRLSRKGEKR